MKSGSKKKRFFSRLRLRNIWGAFFVAIFLYTLNIFFGQTSRWLKSTLFGCPTVDIVCTHFYSSQIKQQIVLFVQSQLSNANYLSFDAANFYSSLKEHFDYVTQVTITKRLPMGFCIKIKGVDPVMRINQTSVLATDCGVYPDMQFTKFAGLGSLPHFIVPSLKPGMKVTKTTYADLQNLASGYHEDYICTYYDQSNIQLVPRKKKLYESIFTNSQFCVKKMHKQVLDDIANDVLRRGLCSQKALDKRLCSIELDMRFEQRIIVRVIDHGKRGRGI